MKNVFKNDSSTVNVKKTKWMATVAMTFVFLLVVSMFVCFVANNTNFVSPSMQVSTMQGAVDTSSDVQAIKKDVVDNSTQDKDVRAYSDKFYLNTYMIVDGQERDIVVRLYFEYYSNIFAGGWIKDSSIVSVTVSSPPYSNTTSNVAVVEKQDTGVLNEEITVVGDVTITTRINPTPEDSARATFSMVAVRGSSTKQKTFIYSVITGSDPYISSTPNNDQFVW